MYFLTVEFYIFLLLLVCFYYIVPASYRWYVLLAGSICMYLRLSPKMCWLLFLTIFISYGAGILIFKKQNAAAKTVFILAVVQAALPLLILKKLNPGRNIPWLVPVGISFYTLQIISYLADIYHGKIEKLPGFFQYTLYILFFPQIVQGPIPRYGQLGGQLYQGHSFSEKGITKAIHLIIWGFFLKFMIADKSAVFVNEVFDHYRKYAGTFILLAGILYSIQLYTDFLACVCIAKGAAGLFGIDLADNFNHPYMAGTIKDFWRRWHITLSTWLRDYVYIPLGGNRKGRLRKYINLLLTFAVSGVWHGTGYRYLFWGLMHGCYQIAGEITYPARKIVFNRLKMPEKCLFRKIIQTACTLFWVMLAWIIFRADSLSIGIAMIKSMFQVYNPWVVFNGALLQTGVDLQEWAVLLLSVLLLVKVSICQQKMCIRDWILEQDLLFRWLIYIGAVITIFIFGTYGYGFYAQDFIYGGF